MIVEHALLDLLNFGTTLFNNEDMSILFFNLFIFFRFPISKSSNSDGVKNELHPV